MAPGLRWIPRWYADPKSSVWWEGMPAYWTPSARYPMQTLTPRWPGCWIKQRRRRSLDRTDFPVRKHAPGRLLQWPREFRAGPWPSAEPHETRRQEKHREIGNADYDELGEHQAVRPPEQPSRGADHSERDVRKRQDQDRLCRCESA